MLNILNLDIKVVLFIVNPDFQLLLIEAILMTILSIMWFCYSKKIILKSMKKTLKE